MRKKTMADGILGISIAAALASTLSRKAVWLQEPCFTFPLPLPVGGFADWFGVTSLSRKPWAYRIFGPASSPKAGIKLWPWPKTW